MLDQYKQGAIAEFDQEAFNNKYASETLDFIKTLLNKDELKQLTEDHPDFNLFVSAMVKNLAISNISKSDVTYILHAFDDAKTATLMAKPPGAFTWEKEYIFSQLRPLIFLEACRSVDGFERRMQATQIQQVISQGERIGGESSQSGLFGNVKRMFGRA